MASKMFDAHCGAATLQRSYQAAMVASGTGIVSGLTFCDFWLKRIHDDARLVLLHRVALFLRVPVIKLIHFFSKRTILVQHRRLLALSVYCASIGGEELPVEVRDRLPKLDLVADLYEALDGVGKLRCRVAFESEGRPK